MKQIILIILIGIAVIFAAEFHVDKEQENLVKFTSDAPVEKIVGVTDKIDGYILWQDDNFAQNSEFYFEVDLASIDTGIGLRNRHMRENYLETDKYPFASYGGQITQVVDNEDGTFMVTTSGTFKLHGVEREIQLDGLVSKIADGYKAESRFEVKLADYNIERPQFMFLKIGEVIQLEVTFFTKEFKE